MKYMGIIWACMVCLFTACDVHEWPENMENTSQSGQVNSLLRIKLAFRTDMDEMGFPYESRSSDEYDMRYTLKAFPLVEGDQTLSETAVWEHSFTRSVSMNDYDCEVEVNIPKGRYNVMVWADYVGKSTGTPLFYNISNFTEIALSGEYRGGTDFRDAFRGGGKFDNRKNSITDITIDMSRPLAKFEIIAVDFDQFLSQNEGMDLSDCQLIVHYDDMIPCSYNMFTDKWVDTRDDVSFETKLEKINDSETSLGFDYVFMDREEMNIPITISLRDKSGNVLFVSSSIDVPLKRGQYTIVGGEFFTHDDNP